MELPEKFSDIIRKSEERFKDNIDKAVVDAEKKIRKLPEFDDFVQVLISEAIRSRIHDTRHYINRVIKEDVASGSQQEGDSESYVVPKPKVVVGRNKSVNEVERTVYDIRIANKCLGSIFGYELSNLAESESATARGYQIRAKLCLALVPLVPESKTVRQAISSKKLHRIYESILKEEGVAFQAV